MERRDNVLSNSKNYYNPRHSTTLLKIVCRKCVCVRVCVCHMESMEGACTGKMERKGKREQETEENDAHTYCMRREKLKSLLA